MKEISLTQGKVTLVDDTDFDFLMRWRWHAKKDLNGKYYAIRTVGKCPGMEMIYMHREIMQTPVGKWTDHCDNDGLNNRQSNLRVCDPTFNAANRKKKEGTASRFKGVSWSAPMKQWRARVSFKRKEIILGYFRCEEAAAREYDRKARDIFGEFAKLNF